MTFNNRIHLATINESMEKLNEFASAGGNKEYAFDLLVESDRVASAALYLQTLVYAIEDELATVD